MVTIGWQPTAAARESLWSGVTRGLQRTARCMSAAFPNAATLTVWIVLIVSAIGSTAGQAQTRTTVVDVVKPILLAQLLVPPAGWYDTPQEAWAAYKTLYVDVELTPRYGTVVQNLRPCVPPKQFGYWWGVPHDWCWDIDMYANDNYGFDVVNYIAVSGKCPDGYDWANVPPLSGTGYNGVPYVFERRCEKRIPVRDPRLCCEVGNPVVVESGSKRQRETDYVDPRGILTFVRTYDSIRGGFAHNFAADFLSPQKGSTASCSLLKTTYSHGSTVFVRKFCYARLRPDSAAASFMTAGGDRYEFSWNGTAGTPLLPYTKDRLIASSSGGWILSMLGEHRQYILDAAGRLESVATIDGQRVQLAYSSAAIADVAPGAGYLTTATDAFGRTLQFRYSAGGQLVKLIDPNGQEIAYEHEALAHPPLDGQSSPWAQSAKPSKVTYQDGSSTSYLWDEPAYATGSSSVHLLTGIVDGNGGRFATFQYSNGKANSTEHAGGVEKYSVTDPRSASTGTGPITVTDPLGTTRTWEFALAAGIPRIASISRPAGAGSAASSSTFTYDANGNVASRTDFNGYKTCSANDLSRNLETRRVEGLGSTATCAALIVDGASLPAGARKTSTQWHPLWNLPVLQAEPGRITTSIYNGQPDSTGAVVKCAPDTALLPDGSPIAVVCTKTERATTDATGALGFAATVDGLPRTWAYTYNEHGQVLTARDPLNNQTTYIYYGDTSGDHSQGDLESMTNSAGHATQYTHYDKSGRLLRSVDANGTVTQASYTPRGWVKTVTVTPSGSAAQLTVYGYDGVGQLKKATLPDGTVMEYSYDAAHRLTGVKDAASNSVTYTLDNMGNRKGEELKDASGTLVRNLTRVYDALNRVQSATGAVQ